MSGLSLNAIDLNLLHDITLHVTVFACNVPRENAGCTEVNVVMQGKTCLRLSSLQGRLMLHAGGCKQAELNRAIRATL